MTGLATPDRVLAVGAHPDDIEFGCGGTLARWAKDGATVVMAIMTDGSKGSWDAGRDRAQLAAERKAEQQRAAAVLAADAVVMLDHVDGELWHSPELRTQLCRLIRTHKPNVLLTHDPWKPYELHPDHRVTGWAVLDGLISARDPLFEPDMGIPPHRPEHLLLWKAAEPDHWEDVSSTWATKIEALLCHASQGETTMDAANHGEIHREHFEERMRHRARELGAPAGLPLAESFKKLTP